MPEVSSHNAKPVSAFLRLSDFRIQAFIISLLALIFYGNTYYNDYALDDETVIVRNDYVLEGFKGIPDIFSHDAYHAYFSRLGTSDHLKGGRYRPLSVATFAIEQQFFGAIPQEKVDSVVRYGMSYEMNEPYEKLFLEQMHVRHLVNVLLFALSVVVLLYFLRFVVFRQDATLAFVAALFFTMHPIHTEVVANVKSRDEILSLLFICLTFVFGSKFLENRRKFYLLAMALLSYFLAFLSKEYAISLVVLLPLSFYLFNGKSVRNCLLATLPYLGVAILYIFIRVQITGWGNETIVTDIQINPYAFATPVQKIATEIATSLNYVKLLLFPHPLSSDYSYNQIPYKDFSNPLVWLSLLVHLGLFAGFVYFLRKKNVLSFAIAFYLVNLLMVCNVIFDIGATMGERLIYHASVGFAIAAAYIVCNGFRQIGSVRFRISALAGFVIIIIVLCGYKTIARNMDWKNNQALYFKDINASPNSFFLNVNVATLLVNKSDYEKDEQARLNDLHRSIPIFDKVLSMQDTYVLGYMNRGIAWYKLGDADKLIADLDKIRSMYPAYPPLPGMYFRAAEIYANRTQFDKARASLNTLLELHPGDQYAISALQKIDSLSTLKQ